MLIDLYVVAQVSGDIMKADYKNVFGTREEGENYARKEFGSNYRDKGVVVMRQKIVKE